ncbi:MULTISPECIES: hypothetical protein [unclassified Dyella]|uniref:hypothetical protein n=1 Tax=Dyella sp. ASV21 TaxID=2795114 RepID=UPI0018EB4447|nr:MULTISPECIES: hypothetical protein [unclassified Dyella]
MSRQQRSYHEQLEDVREHLRQGAASTRSKHADATARRSDTAACTGAKRTQKPQAGERTSAAAATANIIDSVERAAADTRHAHTEGAAKRADATHDTFAHTYHHANTAEERRDAADRIERNDERHRASEDKQRGRHDWLTFGKFVVVIGAATFLGWAAIKAGRVPLAA